MEIPKTIDLIFGSGRNHGGEADVEQTIEEQDENTFNVSEDEKGKELLRGVLPFTKRISAYVEVMEDMVNQIANFEVDLLSFEEREMLFAFSKLKYSARYTLMRLAFRKPNQWHPRTSMQRFVQEIGEKGLNEALVDLCDTVPEIIKKGGPSGENAGEPIDLTTDSDDEEDIQNHEQTRKGLSSTSDARLDFFCENESHMALEDILHRLTKPKLVELCREFKFKPCKNPKRDDLISTLLSHAENQCSLIAFASPNCKKHKFQQRTLLNFAGGPSRNSLNRLRTVAAEKLGSCLRLNSDFLYLIRRLQVIYYRSTEHLPSLLLPSLLTHFNKRTYPTYSYARSVIWSNREEFLEYEYALDILEVTEKVALDKGETERARTRGMTETTERMESRARTVLGTPAPPGKVEKMETPMKVKKVKEEVKVEKEMEEEEIDWFLEGDVSIDNDLDFKGHEIRGKGQLSIYEIMAKAAQVAEEEDEGKEMTDMMRQSRKQARMLVEVYEKSVKEMWEKAVRDEEAKTERPGPELERFQAGHVLTRIVSKVASAFATLKEYKREAEILDALLAQRFWRRGKRADWYERRALVGQNYVAKQSKEGLRRVRDGIIEALHDNDTHLIARPALFRRLEKVEKKLKMPEEERTRSEGELKEANEAWVKATRLWESKKNDEKDKEKDRKGKGKENQITSTTGAKGIGVVGNAEKPEWKWKGKSLWRGRTFDEEINVETVALYHYEDQGFKGFHSETSILTTLFALLFWDIIFATIPGAFETKYQIAPLDLIEDSFYRARKEMIDKRLEEIRSRKGRKILEKHYEMYGGSTGNIKDRTWCVGMRWDVGTKEDLGEIVECMGGETLVHICKLFCEDYAARTSGVPDLIVWNFESKECRFVEVKGPGDRASANQKLWFDTLLRAGTAVDLCHVEDGSGRSTSIKSAGKGKGRQPMGGSEEENDSQNSDDEGEWLPHGNNGFVSRKRTRSEDGDADAVLVASQERFRISTPAPECPTVMIVSPSMVKKRKIYVEYIN